MKEIELILAIIYAIDLGFLQFISRLLQYTHHLVFVLLGRIPSPLFSIHFALIMFAISRTAAPRALLGMLLSCRPMQDRQLIRF